MWPLRDRPGRFGRTPPSDPRNASTGPPDRGPPRRLAFRSRLPWLGRKPNPWVPKEPGRPGDRRRTARRSRPRRHRECVFLGRRRRRPACRRDAPSFPVLSRSRSHLKPTAPPVRVSRPVRSRVIRRGADPRSGRPTVGEAAGPPPTRSRADLPQCAAAIARKTACPPLASLRVKAEKRRSPPIP